MPTQPPDFAALLREAMRDADRFPRVIRASGPFIQSRYFHWDDIRRRQPPGDLSSHEWWLAVKLARTNLYQSVPLLDLKGAPFLYLMADPILEKLHRIDMRAGGLIQSAPDPVVNPATKDQYYVRSLMEEAIRSSQMEGASTTRRVAREMLRTGRRPRSNDERMIVNNYRAMSMISEELVKQPLTAERILHLHQTLTEGTLEDPASEGRLRRSGVTEDDVAVSTVDGDVHHVPPPAAELASRVERLCAFGNADDSEPFIHPVVRSIIIHFWLAYDHPFVDGNGRTARALFYWSMLRHGYWLCEYISISRVILKAKKQYELAFLLTESDDNDLTYFILNQLDVAIRAIDDLYAYLDRESTRVRAAEADLRGLTGLNHRQRALVSHALRHPHQVYTIQGHRRSHNVVYQTARSDLLGLVELGLFRGDKSSKKWQFTAVPNLREEIDRQAQWSTED